MKWWIFVLAFLLGALLTWIALVRRATREVRIIQEVPLRGTDASLGAATGAGTALGATAVVQEIDEDVAELDPEPVYAVEEDTAVDLPPVGAVDLAGAGVDLDAAELDLDSAASAVDLDAEVPAVDLDAPSVDLDAAAAGVDLDPPAPAADLDLDGRAADLD